MAKITLKGRKIQSEIFTGSMADISFLLIIYFMVTSVFSATRGLDFQLPEEDKETPEIKREDSIDIFVNPGGSLTIDPGVEVTDNGSGATITVYGTLTATEATFSRGIAISYQVDSSGLLNGCFLTGNGLSIYSANVNISYCRITSHSNG